MNFIVYNQYGEILRTGSCPDDFVQLQSQPNESVMTGNASDELHYINAGIVVAKPAKPSDHHIFNFKTKQWVDPRVLADFKEAKWDEVKAARATAISANLTTPYGDFDADPSSSLNIIKAVLLAQTLANAGEPVAIDYTLADNTVVTLDAEQMTRVGILLGEREQQVRNKATDLRTQIDACTTKEQLESIAW